MAKNITLEQIIKDASRGILHPISVLRKTTLDTSLIMYVLESYSL